MKLLTVMFFISPLFVWGKSSPNMEHCEQRTGGISHSVNEARYTKLLTAYLTGNKKDSQIKKRPKKKGTGQR
ncbi:MAG: hypothetical protein GDA46_00235 [Bdellovibrionales bacterium]|nr:hypothetical protein [Bdellovibrionales bacterium]